MVSCSSGSDTAARTRLRILAVSYWYPPAPEARAVQVSRLLTSLDASIVLLCGEKLRSGGVVEEGTPCGALRVLRQPQRRSRPSRYLSTVAARWAVPVADLPDPQVGWANQLVRRVRHGHLELNFEPDLLVTFGCPMSDHLFGIAYQQMTHKPWIAHFSDPWVENPFNPHNRWIDALNRRWERQVIGRADAVIFTSPETIDLVMKKYPASWRAKVSYLPHCFDHARFDRRIEPANDRYVVRYLGSFYGPRSPRPLYEAVERIARDAPALLDGVSFELVGPPCADPELDRRYPAAAPIIRLLGNVTYEESIRLMSTAHCLLVIDAPAERSVFFPSKLVDYIGSGRFILALSPLGASERIVRELGGFVADPSDPGAVLGAVSAVLKRRPRSLPRSGDHYEKVAVSQEFTRLAHATVQQQAHSSPGAAETLDRCFPHRSEAA